MPRKSTTAGLLFEFGRGSDRFRCELRDHGRYGVEARVLLNGEFLHSRRFDGGGSGEAATLLAVAWAARRAASRLTIP
jgi:hypothetical protein